MKRNILIGIFLYMLIISQNIFGQETDFSVLKDLVDESKEEVEALALYPDDIRDAILETTTHPELLVKLRTIQTRTSASFHQLIRNLPEESQEKYWELTRYPGLITQLVEGGQKSRKDITTLLANYPEAVHDIALDYGVTRYRTLEKIHSINQAADSAVALLLEDYDESIQASVRQLLQFPEVLHILAEHIDIAILVGEAYTTDPEWVKRKADSVRLEASRRYLSEIESWKKSLEEDPQALEEFEKASRDFVNENDFEDYDPLYPNFSTPKDISGEADEPENEPIEGKADVHIHYNYYPYPYWFGYPYWFPPSYWYRFPYWYHWGFYYGTDRSLFIWGVPSYFYIHWYFRYPSHHRRYPHLSDHIIRHYQRTSRTSRSGLDMAVSDWEKNSRSRIPGMLLDTDNAGRTERIKEYGQFEEAYQKRIQRDPRKEISRDEFLDKNRKRYPYLSGDTDRQNPDLQKRDRNEGQSPVRSNTGNVKSIRPTRSIELNRARDVHQRTWERSDYTRSRVQPSPPSRSTRERRN